MESTVNDQMFWGASFLELPDENDVFAEDEETNESLIKPKLSPLPRRRRSSEEDESPEPPTTLNRKVSFADTFGLELVSVREYDKWDVPTGPLGYNVQDEGPPPEEYVLTPSFEVPASPEELMEKVFAQKVELEFVEFPPEFTSMKGVIRVQNIAYEKLVYVRVTLNNWDSYCDLPAEYTPGFCDDETDQFTFKVSFVPPERKDGGKVEFAICYETPIGTYWANNNQKNYGLLCHKKVTENPQEEISDRNLRSCLKTSYGKESFESTLDINLGTQPNTEDQQEEGWMDLEMNTFKKWNSEILFDENTEGKTKNKQQPDTQICQSLHISLTNPRGQETSLAFVEGSHTENEEKNGKHDLTVSRLPLIHQQEIESIQLTDVTNDISAQTKQGEESELPAVVLDSTCNLSSQSHEGHINTTVQTNSANIITNNENTMTQSSNLFCINETHLMHEDNSPQSQRREEALRSYVTDTSTKSMLNISSLLHLSDDESQHVSANDVWENLVTVEDIDRCGEPSNNSSESTDLLHEKTDAKDASDEPVYLTGDTSTDESESALISLLCNSTQLESEPQKISVSSSQLISSEGGKVLMKADCEQGMIKPWCYTETENEDNARQEKDMDNLDFSEQPIILANKETEVQDPIDKVSTAVHFEIEKEMSSPFKAAIKEERSYNAHLNCEETVVETVQHVHNAPDTVETKEIVTGLEDIPSSNHLEIANALKVEIAEKCREIEETILDSPQDEEKYQASAVNNEMPVKSLGVDTRIGGDQKDTLIATQNTKQFIDAPPHGLVDSIVKKAIEDALCEIRKEERTTVTTMSQECTATQFSPNIAMFSESVQEETSTFELIPNHKKPSKINVIHEQTMKCNPQFSEHKNLLSAEAIAGGEETVKNTVSNFEENTKEQEIAAVSCYPGIVPDKETSLGLSGDVKHSVVAYNDTQAVKQNLITDALVVLKKDVPHSLKIVPHLLDAGAGGISSEATNTCEGIAEDVSKEVDFKIEEYGQIRHVHTEDGNELTINSAELPEEKMHNNKVDCEDKIQMNVKRYMEESHYYSIADVKKCSEVETALTSDLKGAEEMPNIKIILQPNDERVEPQNEVFTYLHDTANDIKSETMNKIVSAPPEIAEEEASCALEPVPEITGNQHSGEGPEDPIENQGEAIHTFAESQVSHHFESIAAWEDNHQMEVNEGSGQEVVRPTNNVTLDPTASSSSISEGKKNNVQKRHSSEPSSNRKRRGPVILKNPIKTQRIGESLNYPNRLSKGA
eukprot:gi/632954049/ref/XP_007892757.1/ PREDICTED: protein phosphatase 1 regulatory subunit 3A isoform X2 [Callorhinchus milii]